MHEYSIVQAPHDVCVQVGELSGVEVSLLKTAYDLFRQDTVCAHAELKVETVDARWECRACGEELRRRRGGSGAEEPVRRSPRAAADRFIPAAEPVGPLACDRCGGPVKLAQGDEIVLARLELEVG